MEKGGLLIGIFFILSLIFISNLSALGISPASREINFQPGLELTINYNVKKATDLDLEVSVFGDLAEYITLSKDKLVGTENTFSAILKLPDYLEVPGRHKIYVRVKEVLDEELGGNFIATTISLKSRIDVYVPYPGQYLEIELKSKNVNVGEPVEFNLEVVSRGTKGVSINPRIEIYDVDGKKVETLYFKNRIIAGQETLNLKKSLDTTNYNPGNYKAIAIIDYGGLAKSESEFKIGDLNIGILNYTHVIPIGKLQKFDILVESGWNNNIDGVYGEVVFLNNTGEMLRFKTSTTSLTPWEQKIIIGYFETSNFTEGFYDANITLFYFGKDVGKSSSELVKVEFVKAPFIFIWYIVGGAGLLIIIGLVLIKFLRKGGKRERKK